MKQIKLKLDTQSRLDPRQCEADRQKYIEKPYTNLLNDPIQSGKRIHPRPTSDNQNTGD